MSIEQKARELLERSFILPTAHQIKLARLGIIEGVKMAIKALQDDAELCDCSAYEESECACGAWCEWKTIPSHRAVEIVCALIEEQKA